MRPPARLPRTGAKAIRRWAWGEGSHIEGAIIDKNARIGRNVRIINEQGLENTEETPFGMIRDGIVVTAKNTTFAGWMEIVRGEAFPSWRLGNDLWIGAWERDRL